MPKQVANMALRSALSAKLAVKQLEIWQRIDIGSHRTAALDALLKLNNWNNVLFVDDASSADEPADPAAPATTVKAFELAASNLGAVTLLPVQRLNVYDLLKRDIVVLSRSAAVALDHKLAPRQQGRLPAPLA